MVKKSKRSPVVTLTNAKVAGTNAHLYARLSYLYRASQYTLRHSSSLSRFYVNTLRSVAKKSVIRLDQELKRTLCKRCNTMLIPEISAEHTIENKSKGEKKKWADVLLVKCKVCDAVKRFPVGMDGWEIRKKTMKGKHGEGGDGGKVKEIVEGAVNLEQRTCQEQHR